MATALELEQSREDSRPIEIYEIFLGGDVFRYTSAEDDLTIGGEVFTAIPIARNHVIQGSDQQKRSLLITVPTTNPFAAKYIDVVPGEQADLTLMRYQRDEVPAFNTFVLLFSGKVQSVDFSNDGLNARIAVRSSDAALSRNVPRVNFGGMCGAFLYDAFCGANPSMFNHIGEITLVSKDDITVTGAAASGFDFKGGYVKPTTSNDFRLVRKQVGDVLTLSLPFHLNELGSDAQVFAGCNHLIDGDCALVFDRVIDFLGFAFVANKDIWRSGIQ
ncbi:hypothetical protein LCGC14_2348600 [marine sediment metagenome]|uniref:Uncharacterized protein n=1 Tax=marine sediment metagenome TaxID=412755 RepID=A0A0F9CAL1_9ZZZZ